MNIFTFYSINISLFVLYILYKFISFSFVYKKNAPNLALKNFIESSIIERNLLREFILKAESKLFGTFLSACCSS